MSTIAIFSTYVPSEGFGGPSRVFHQRRALEAAGYTVVHIVVEATPSRGNVRNKDLVVLVERPFREPLDHIYADVDLARRTCASPRDIERIRSHLVTEGVTLVILEQPFLVEVVAAATNGLALPMIYSCQNIEYRLRRDLERFQFMMERPTTRSDEVRDIERAAVEMAAAVTTICTTDQVAMREEFGCDSVVVPNGTSVATTVACPTNFVEPVDFAFAGSSYWPNLEGFAQMASPSLAFLPPTTRIHVLGSAGNDLLGVPSIARRYSVNASRIVLRGFVEMDELVATMMAARCVLVPVFVGEGSNLKSADALAASVPVIMTERATRGYEDVLEADAEGVTVVNDAREFRSAMAAALALPRSGLVGGERRHLLKWDRRLEPLVEVVGSVLNESPRLQGWSHL